MNADNPPKVDNRQTLENPLADSNSKEFDHQFAASFAQIAFTTNRFIIHHMRRLMNDLDVDSETAIIWGSLAQLNYAHLLHPNINHEAYVQPEAKAAIVNAAKPARLVDLTQVTGIPKESVRRKLKELEHRGKVKQTSPRQWIIAEAGVDEETFEFTKTTTRLLLETAKDITNLLSRA